MNCVYCHVEMIQPVLWKSFFRHEESVVCETCQNLFHQIQGDTCKRCGRLEKEAYCYDCIRWMNGEDCLQYNRSLYHYDDEMKEWFNRFKFRGDVALLQMFQREWLHHYNVHFREMDGVVPIPLSKERSYERSFNQSQLLADIIDVPIFHALERVHSEKQSKKGRKERLRRENVFRGVLKVRDKRIVLVDDLYTTGVTLHQAASMLKEQGAKEVYACTLARA